ncbi:MAG TPA: DUF4070 domain-containing protein, partial [Polyangiaceae bacterium]
LTSLRWAADIRLLPDLTHAACPPLTLGCLRSGIGKPVAISRVTIDDLVITARAVARIGILSARRKHFWRLLARAATRGSHALRRAITFAVQGEHLIEYTEHTVLPRIEHALRQTPREAPHERERRRVVRLPIAAGAMPPSPEAVEAEHPG